MSDPLPYRVEVDSEGCESCGHGRTFLVVGPDNVALAGATYDSEQYAQSAAQELTEAWEAGRGVTRESIERLSVGATDEQKGLLEQLCESLGIQRG